MCTQLKLHCGVLLQPKTGDSRAIFVMVLYMQLLCYIWCGVNFLYIVVAFMGGLKVYRTRIDILLIFYCSNCMLNRKWFNPRNKVNFLH